MSGSDTASSDNDICRRYSEMLPNGPCIEYLGDRMVLIEKGDRDLNVNIDFWMNLVVPAILNLIKVLPRPKFEKHSYDKLTKSRCLNETDYMRQVMKKVVENIPSLYEEGMKNIPYYKWFACRYLYPICIPDVSHISQPCRSEYDIIASNKLSKLFLDNIHNLTTHCPKIFNDEGYIYHRENFRQANIRHVERCSLYTPSRRRQYLTAECFNRKGETYNGTRDKALNGKTCARWDAIPTIRNMQYPNLIKNYCRNPDGYGTQPWCYTDVVRRDWAYCDVVQCRDKKTRHTSYVLFTVLPLCFVSCLMLFLFLLYRKRKGRRRRRQSNPDNDDPCYASYYFNSSDKIERLINYNEDSLRGQ